MNPDSHNGADDVLVAKYSIPSVSGIDQLDTIDAKIFHNPSRTNLVIEVDDSFIGETYTFTTLDGRTITSDFLSDNYNSIDIGATYSGLYILTILNANGSFSQRVIIE